MTGAEHFREAENHLHHAACAAGVEPANEARHLSYAQVHATLAAAAEKNSGPPWTLEDVTAMATELRELRAAVRPALGYLDQTPGGRAVAVELRKLVR